MVPEYCSRGVGVRMRGRESRIAMRGVVDVRTERIPSTVEQNGVLQYYSTSTYVGVRLLVQIGYSTW